MAVIGFSDKPEEIWCVAGWAFRQILEDVVSQYQEDFEMADAFAIAETHSGLGIDLLNPPLAERVTKRLRKVAEDILSGTVRSGIHDKSYGDKETFEQYRNGLVELLTVIPAR